MSNRIVQLGWIWILCSVFGLWMGCAGPKEQKSAGSLHVSAKLDQASPKTGQHTLWIDVHSKEGKAMSGATIEVKPHMPAHGHGSSEQAKIEELGKGKYKATPVTFQMPGEWEIIVDVSVGAEKGRFTLKVNVQ